MNMKKVTVDNEDRYIRKCINALKNRGLPVTGWECIEIYDCKEEDEDAPLEVCEICGCSKVRYVHVMYNTLQNIELHVGCICAGVMEGDVMRAKERERLLKNRTSRKKNFMKKKWKRVIKGVYSMRYKGINLMVKRTAVGVTVFCGSKFAISYKGLPITSYTLASHAAFELVDPIKEVHIE